VGVKVGGSGVDVNNGVSEAMIIGSGDGTPCVCPTAAATVWAIAVL
jgi:hypothetical protein